MKFNTYIYRSFLFIAEESAPTTPTTPKPVPTVRKQRYVQHRPSGVSHQGVYSDGSGISSCTNISKKVPGNDNNDDVENKGILSPYFIFYTFSQKKKQIFFFCWLFFLS